jgi:hypothetical protein
MPDNHGPIAPHQQRAFEAARRAAMLLCRGYDRRPSRFRHHRDPEEDPETIERVRWLIVAMGLARGTPGGLAIAALARRGYVVARTPVLTVAGWSPVALDHPGIVYLGEPLPRHDRPWSAIERRALRIDAGELPHLRFGTGHTALRIVTELRRQGHAFG